MSSFSAIKLDIWPHPALSFVEKESQTIGGFGRNYRFSYTQRFGGPGEVVNRVLLEAGTASGLETLCDGGTAFVLGPIP